MSYREIFEEMEAMKNRLMWEACLPPGDMVLSVLDSCQGP